MTRTYEYRHKEVHLDRADDRWAKKWCDLGCAATAVAFVMRKAGCGPAVARRYVKELKHRKL